MSIWVKGRQLKYKAVYQHILYALDVRSNAAFQPDPKCPLGAHEIRDMQSPNAKFQRLKASSIMITANTKSTQGQLQRSNN